MVKEFIYIEMVHHIMENGMKINNMDLDVKDGLMEHHMKEIILWV